MKNLSIDTYIDRTPNKIIIEFLRDRGITSKVYHGMSKRQIRYILDSSGLLRTAEKEINRIRGLSTPYKIDFQKYKLG